MRLDKLAVTSQQAVVIAMGIAAEHQAGATEPEHLLLALLEGREGNLKPIIERIGADPANLEKLVAEKIEAAPKVSGGLAMQFVLEMDLDDDSELRHYIGED